MNETKETPRMWDARKHRSWGDAIRVENWERRCISGHTTPRPKLGDFVIFLCPDKQHPEKKERLAQFRIVELRLCPDPKDMWFATIEDVGWIEEKDIISEP